jgi:hypothetical protein
VPAIIGGEELWSLTIGTSCGLLRAHHSTTDYRAYVGVSLHCSFDDDTFWSLPDMYPDGYYMPTALRASLRLGLEVRTNRHAAYVEMSSLDIALHAKGRNWDTLGWEEVVTLGVGYRHLFLPKSPSAPE